MGEILQLQARAEATPPPPRRAQRADETLAQYFGAALRQRRLDMGMTQATVSHYSGLSAAKMPAFEAGEKALRLETAWSLAQAVWCHLADLLPPHR